MKLTHLTAADYRRVPWKNGGGMTTEILVEPRDATTDFLWRVSIAEVEQSGPFSDFSGCDRTIMLLEGAGFVLRFADAPERRIDRPHEHFAFPGDWRTDCTLIDGPVRDFNLIAARHGPAAKLEVLRLPPGSAEIAGAATLLLHLLAGAASIAGRRLAVGDTLRIDGPATAVWAVADEPSALAVIRVAGR